MSKAFTLKMSLSVSHPSIAEWFGNNVKKWVYFYKNKLKKIVSFKNSLTFWIFIDHIHSHCFWPIQYDCKIIIIINIIRVANVRVVDLSFQCFTPRSWVSLFVIFLFLLRRLIIPCTCFVNQPVYISSCLCLGSLSCLTSFIVVVFSLFSLAVVLKYFIWFNLCFLRPPLRSLLQQPVNKGVEH